MLCSFLSRPKFAFALLLVLSCFAHVKTSIGEPISPLRVAFNLPMSGPFAIYGAAVREGVEFALEEVEEFDKASLVLDWEDNEGVPVKTVSALRKQLAQKPDIYMSGVRPQTMAIWDELVRLKLPHFLWIFDMSIVRDSAPQFRMLVNFRVEAPVLVQHARTQNAKKIAILYVQLPSTDAEYQDSVVPLLRADGRNVLVEPYSLERTEFRDLALRVKAFQPDLIFLSGFQSHLVTMVRDLRGLQLIREGNTVGTYDLLDAAPLLTPDDLEGIRVSVPTFLVDGNPKFRAWKSGFKKRFGKDPLYTNAYAYDMGKVFIDVARRKKQGELSVASVTNIESLLRSTKLDGLTGPIVFPPSGDLELSIELGVFRGGVLQRFTAEPRLDSPPPIAVQAQ